MNLEEIKEWREQNNVEFDDAGMVMRSIDWLINEVDRLSGSELEWYAKGQDDAAKPPEKIKNIDRLLAELKKLQAEIEKYQKLIAGNSQAQIDWVDVTSKRCAEIAEKHGCSQCMGIGSRCCADAIRKEFNHDMDK